MTELSTARAIGLVLALESAGCVAMIPPEAPTAPRHSTTEVARSEASERGVVDTARPPGAETPEKTPPSGEVALPVPGFDPAVVSFPSSGPAPQPLIVVAHGAKDLPEAQCRLWRAIVGDRGVIVCLAGPRADVKTAPRYFPNHLILEQVLIGTLLALHSAYPDAIDATRALYAGYSQGATMGALMIGPHGHEFPRLALVEGGFEQWTVASAIAFKTDGGQRVLFACGTHRCLEHATTSARFLHAAGLEARVVSNLSQGHAYGSTMEKLIRDAFEWLVADDARFAVR